LRSQLSLLNTQGLRAMRVINPNFVYSIAACIAKQHDWVLYTGIKVVKKVAKEARAS
jgi:hypothetical protein